MAGGNMSSLASRPSGGRARRVARGPACRPSAVFTA